MVILFILTNIVYRFAHTLFAKHRGFLSLFERQEKLEDDDFCQPYQCHIVIISMGAYRAINSHSDNTVWGLDTNKEKITLITNKGIKA